MEFLGDVVGWFTDSGNWWGTRGVFARLREHVTMSALAAGFALALALPIGIGLGHLRRAGTLAINVSNVGRAVPSFAILVIGVELFGISDYPVVGSLTTFIALVALALPPMVTNAYVGMAGVGDEVREAATGMGMRWPRVLFTIELPLAVPLVMAGVRTATVQVVATATIAAQVGWGGLGRFIIDGIATRDFVEVFAGAVLVATLALATELGLAAVQRLLTAPGLRTNRAAAGARPA